jgi:HEAT repeat protein
MENDDNRYCNLLVECLSQPQKGEKIKDRVIAYFGQDTSANYHLEQYLVELAGNLKIKETVPYLFDILTEVDSLTYVYSSCIEALGRIGTPGVAAEIGLLYPAYKDLRNGLAEIFGYMPYDYAEEKAIRILKEETDPEARTFLAGALCDIFSLKSGDIIMDIIRNRQYDRSIMGLSDYLIPVYVYHNKTIDHLAELESLDREFWDEHNQAHPFFGPGKNFKPLEDEDKVEIEMEDEDVDEEPGAFEPDTVYNQEEKRKPKSRIPSKKRNKSKKKKKKSKRR